MTEQRITCPRQHWLFSVVPEGIAIKCRAGECRVVYVITWEELEVKRQEVIQSQEKAAYEVTSATLGGIQ